MCSNPLILTQDFAKTGIDKTYVFRDKIDKCEFWILDPVLKRKNTPGKRAQYSAKTAVPDVGLGVSKPGAIETINASYRKKG
ncbi:hypothetical protein FACS1894104_5920 [Actinomycetota bacterium]|nr:hypothetical protein FACS1894104_5920 [Actinomycetota bacterium]